MSTNILGVEIMEINGLLQGPRLCLAKSSSAEEVWSPRDRRSEQEREGSSGKPHQVRRTSFVKARTSQAKENIFIHRHKLHQEGKTLLDKDINPTKYVKHLL